MTLKKCKCGGPMSVGTKALICSACDVSPCALCKSWPSCDPTCRHLNPIQ